MIQKVLPMSISRTCPFFWFVFFGQTKKMNNKTIDQEVIILLKPPLITAISFPKIHNAILCNSQKKVILSIERTKVCQPPPCQRWKGYSNWK